MQSLRCLIKHRSPAISWSFVYKILNMSYESFLGKILYVCANKDKGIKHNINKNIFFIYVFLVDANIIKNSERQK